MMEYIIKPLLLKMFMKYLGILSFLHKPFPVVLANADAVDLYTRSAKK